MLSEFSIMFAGAAGVDDRAADRRAEAPELSRDPAARTLIFRGGLALLNEADLSAIWASIDPDLLALADHPPIFLGLAGGAPRFALELRKTDEARDENLAGGVFTDIRAVLSGLDERDAGPLATARALFNWHDTHRFCARCGGPSDPSDGGWRRDCPACGGQHFPRTDPVVIMLITRGERCLLGRSASFLPGMQSLLAGFVEPGETLEAAVRREILEETQVRVGDVRYLACQPWPFPTSLMIGMQGEALSDQIEIDPHELEEAFWADRTEVAAAVRGEAHWAPARRSSIARIILDDWVTQGDRPRHADHP